MSTNNAMVRLQKACKEKSPLCIGLDTDPSYLPESVISRFPSPAEAVVAYNQGIVEAASQYAACCKVQVAYYEAMGLAGMKAFSDTLKLVRGSGMIAISDIKRGDIADTAKAYARAHFSGDFETDIITINPYMGFDTLEPFVEAATAADKGIFVLLCTSNPGRDDIEKLSLTKGGTVLQAVGNRLNELANRFGVGEGSTSPVGAVVGATAEEDARALRDAYSRIFFLIPGYGAQGGAARVAATLLDNAGGTVNSSRGILCAWKKSAELADKREAGTLTMSDIVGAAEKASEAAMKDLQQAFAALKA